MKNFSQYKLISLIAVFFTAFYNRSFFQNVIEVYPFDGIYIIYTISLALVLISLIIFLFTLFSSKFTTKPLLILVVFVSSFTAYFMDTYHIVIDDNMIRNSLETNLSESSDLFSFQLLMYIFFLGILPSLFIYKAKIEYKTFGKELFAKLKTLILSLIVIVVVILSFSKFYTSFFREHKPLRYHVNPVYWIYSIGNFVNKTLNSGPIIVEEIGKDAKINTQMRSDKNRLIIMVLGETARADRFSLNGYSRETNPLMKKEDVISLSNIYSCGTSTAESLPCMFSIYNRSDYTYKKAIRTENSLDVLNHTNEISILWRDNNSSSKGNAKRVGEIDFRTSKNNTICEDECRDEGMLVGLDDYIKNSSKKDIFIVLHQMGSHGPAYYKRYPKEFKKFTPTCESNQLEKCTQEEVSNTYDNTILYTDYFLSKVINFLKPYSKNYETAMLYMADHGESLGENGIYLHGLPYFMAPKEQKHVASILWLGESMKKIINPEKLNALKDKEFSHDNLFHTILGFFDIESKVYKKDMDILTNAKKPQ